jgi:hypothetical protein
MECPNSLNLHEKQIRAWHGTDSNPDTYDALLSAKPSSQVLVEGFGLAVPCLAQICGYFP